MFDAETKFAALLARIKELESRVNALEKKQRGPVANSGGGPGEEQDIPGP